MNCRTIRRQETVPLNLEVAVRLETRGTVAKFGNRRISLPLGYFFLGAQFLTSKFLF